MDQKDWDHITLTLHPLRKLPIALFALSARLSILPALIGQSTLCFLASGDVSTSCSCPHALTCLCRQQSVCKLQPHTSPALSHSFLPKLKLNKCIIYNDIEHFHIKCKENCL